MSVVPAAVAAIEAKVVSGISSIVSLVVGCLGLNWHLACSVDKIAENSRKRVSVTIESRFVTAKQWITGRMRCRLCEFLRVPANQRTFMRESAYR